MRFIVDLYRYIIYGFCAFTLIVIALVAMQVADRSSILGAPLTGAILIGLVGVLGMFVLGLGATAILVSMHDRHVELVEESERIATALEKIAADGRRAAGAVHGSVGGGQ